MPARIGYREYPGRLRTRIYEQISNPDIRFRQIKKLDIPLCGTIIRPKAKFLRESTILPSAYSHSDFLNFTRYCQCGALFSIKGFNLIRIGGATMKNRKSLALAVATVMILSFAAVPPAHAFVGIAALTAIIAATFASAVIVDKTVVKQKNEPVAENSASKQKIQHGMQTAGQP
jgi:hypothetical protein